MDEPDSKKYEWYRNKMADEKFRQKKRTDEEDDLLHRALSGLQAGDLAPLTELLKSSASGLHPRIAKQLVAMIEQDGDWSDFILKVSLNKAKITRRAQSTSAVLLKNRKDRRIALLVAKLGGHKKGMNEAAIIAACKELECERSTVTKVWGPYKKNVKKRVLHRAWESQMCAQYGGVNTVIEMQEAGELPEYPPEDYTIEGVEEKVNALIDRDLETNNLFS